MASTPTSTSAARPTPPHALEDPTGLKRRFLASGVELIGYINPTGRFVGGGPQGDSGLTGRKIIVDTYGGWGRHSGGAFSGKDPSKVDRSAAYYARYIAKNIVATGMTRAVEVQLAYAIAVAEPVSILVDTFGTGRVDEDRLAIGVRRVFDCRPRAIVEHLDLVRPVYRQTAAYGHFGRSEPDFSWERTDKVEALKDALHQKSPSEMAAPPDGVVAPALRCACTGPYAPLR